MAFPIIVSHVSTQKALAPEISTWPDADPQLIGSRCADCSATTFPAQDRCPKCSGANTSEVLLPRRGTLVAWTTQGFPPGAPYKGAAGKDFVPFGVGLVQLDDVIRVEGRLTENDPAKLKFGMDVELTMIPFTTDDDGNELVTFAFAPKGSEK
ncbi:Zn-ribbon domain-containing OB-fold protein [Mycolicibacterium sp. XJ870]